MASPIGSSVELGLSEEPSCIQTQLNSQVLKSSLKGVTDTNHANRLCRNSNVGLAKDHREPKSEGIEPTAKIIRTDKEHRFLTAVSVNKLGLMPMNNRVHHIRKTRLSLGEVHLRKSRHGHERPYTY